jgi:hypothetical protein
LQVPYCTVREGKTVTVEQNQIVEPSIVLKQVPAKFEEYVKGKVTQNGKGGRPHLLSVFAKQGKDPLEEILNICEQAWIKNRSLNLISKDYDTEYQNVYRTLKDLENLSPTMKEEIAEYIRTVPRRKRWYLPELDVSDYETIQNYIKRGKRDGLKKYKTRIQTARRCWIALGNRDPQYWTADEVSNYLATLTPGSQSGALDAIRQVAPQIAIKGSKDQIQTGRFREKLAIRKKDLFGSDIQMIRDALEENYSDDRTKFDLHITLGAREGASDPNSGLSGLKWENFKNGFTTVDLYESKVRGGIWWRDCPLDLFFSDLPERLRALWTKRGKPTSDRVFLGGYDEVTETYKTIRKVLEETFTGNIDPDLLKEFLTLRPHDADKIHVNLLWEAEIALEVVGGKFVGHNEGVGIMGRGWLNIEVIRKHYLSLSSRSERIKKLRDQVHKYSERFNKPTVKVLETSEETGEN